jgi:hypothetical protein
MLMGDDDDTDFMSGLLEELSIHMMMIACWVVCYLSRSSRINMECSTQCFALLAI